MAAAPEGIYQHLGAVHADHLQNLRDIGASIRADLARVPLPYEVAKAVSRAWQKIGTGYSYAVRSSATAEDLPYASFAGQQDTYLNVSGEDDLLTKVKACFISLFTDRAILYRAQNKFDQRKVLLAVIVQRMVQSEISGILFTADPITGNRNITSIDASYGLGEALVSGVVSADLYQVHKRTNAIVKRQIAEKQVVIRSLETGGTEQVSVGKEKSAQAALSDEQVIELAQLGKQIEAHYAQPQDIEWALEGDTFYVTQSRPITSLYALPAPRPKDDALHVYVSLSHFQVMTDAMPPLSLSILRTLLPFGRGVSMVETENIQTAGGRIYADLAPVLRHPIGRRIVLKAFNVADQLAAGALAELAERQEFIARGKRLNPLKFLPAVLPHVLKMLRMLLWGKSEGVTEKTTELIDDHIRAIKSRLDIETDLQAKLDIAVDELHDLFKLVLGWIPYFVAGGVAGFLLKALLKKRCDHNDLAAIERGLRGNVVTEMNLVVGDLADAARTSDTIKEHLLQTDIDAKVRLARLKGLPGGEDFLHEWNNFMHTYGARGPSEIDLSRPRWQEDPSSVLQMVVNAMGNSELGAHRRHYDHLTVEAEKAAKRLNQAGHKGWWGGARALLARRLMKVSRNLLPLREHHKFLAIRLLALLKPVFIDAGKRLQAETRLDASEDVWFLSLPEILETIDNPKKDLKARILERRGSFEHYRNLSPPRVMTSEGEIPVVKLDGAGAPEGALIGSPVSAGVVEGTAKIVFDPSVETLNPGEILVAPFTDPGWTPLFVNAGGLITEVGGLMTHGSVVAREYGIPAVVGVIDATKLIKNGQRLRLHGDVGYIELLNNHGEEKNSTAL